MLSKLRIVSPALAGFAVAAIGLGTSALLARLDIDRRDADARAQAVSRLSLVQTRLAASLRSTFSPTDGLVHLISIQGGLAPELFAAMAGRVIRDNPGIRNITVAPDDQVSMVFPLTGNEKVIGFKYATRPEQNVTVQKARQLGHPVLAGPVKLVQGGEAFIQRAPVFVAEHDGSPRYWGTVSIVAHVRPLLESSGIATDPELDIAIVGRDDADAPLRPIYGDPLLGGLRPVAASVAVPGDTWELRAVPKGGWPAAALWQSGYFQFGVANSLILAVLCWLLLRHQRELLLRHAALSEEMVARRRIEDSLREEQRRVRASEELLAAIVDNAPVQIHVFDTNGRLILCNQQFEKAVGRRRAEILGKERERFQPAETAGQHQDNDRRVLVAGQAISFEESNEEADGLHTYLTVKCPLYDADGRATGVVGISTDITQRKRSEKDLLLASTVYENTADGIVITDSEGIIVSINKAFTEITGYEPAESIGRNASILKSERQEEPFYSQMWACLLRLGVWQGEIWNRRKNGEIYPEWLTITAVRTASGAVENYVGVFSDISAIKRSQEDLERLAHFDPLTDLPNRILFRDRLTHAFERARRYGHRIAVMLLDLDGFKTVNDSLGHPVGDRLLQEVAGRLQHTVRVEDTVARLGGDEFALILSNLAHGEDSIEVARKVLANLQAPLDAGGHSALVTTSIGIAIFPDDGDDPNTLIRNADAAMYKAKESGRNTYRFYRAEMTLAAQQRLALERALRLAIENREFEVWYQPQVSLASGRHLGAEALVRWRDPARGLVPPNDFIPLAEQTGLVVPLGEQVLEQVCRDIRRWRDARLEVGRVAINVAGPQFHRSDFVGTLRRSLESHGLPPSVLEIEVTETFMMDNPQAVRHILAAIQAMGITTAIDDFGTGYSSLSYLKELPIDTLKIDRTFIAGLPDDSQDAAIARAVLALGRSLQFKVIAEGIETPAQRDFLKAEGCEEGQGYLFARPMPPEDFRAWLTEAAGASATLRS